MSQYLTPEGVAALKDPEARPGEEQPRFSKGRGRSSPIPAHQIHTEGRAGTPTGVSPDASLVRRRWFPATVGRGGFPRIARADHGRPGCDITVLPGRGSGPRGPDGAVLVGVYGSAASERRARVRVPDGGAAGGVGDRGSGRARTRRGRTGRSRGPSPVVHRAPAGVVIDEAPGPGWSSWAAVNGAVCRGWPGMGTSASFSGSRWRI